MGYALYTTNYRVRSNRSSHTRQPSLTAASYRRRQRADEQNMRGWGWAAAVAEAFRNSYAESVYPFLGTDERALFAVSSARAGGMLAPTSARVPTFIKTRKDALRCLRAFTGPKFHAYPALVVLSYVDIKIRAGKSKAGVRAKLERIELEIPAYWQVYGMVRDLRRLGPSSKLDVPWPPRYNEQSEAAGAAREFHPLDRRQPSIRRRDYMWWETREGWEMI
ncbi:uncharacterized protein LOC62_05G007517 [Vanrija pseudolonga]|uniref:Uncharacterized protein n=1 Tax=Vanrija pseudolonga TaxID=143232 RepID=A0AAF0YG45_9TREE|nr:hypothetical protein LOC62_05G007517 [Vanrija pseudolonga]